MTTKNFDWILTDLNDTPMMPSRKSGEPATAREWLVEALCAFYHDETGVTPADKFARGTLAMKVKAGGDIEFTDEELADIRNVAGRGGNPAIVYRIFNYIDDKVEPTPSSAPVGNPITA